jgi:hypothetical protein
MPEVTPQGQANNSTRPLSPVSARRCFRAIAKRPLSGTGWPRYRSDLGFWKTEIFFQKGLDTQTANAAPDLPRGKISGPIRGCFYSFTA